MLTIADKAIAGLITTGALYLLQHYGLNLNITPDTAAGIAGAVVSFVVWLVPNKATPNKATPSGGPSSSKFGAAGAVIFALLILNPHSARAADVLDANANPAAPRLFAPVASPCTLLSCSGFYAGFNIAGQASNANIIGNGINGSLAAGGQSLGGDFGYQYWNGTFFFGPEVDASYMYGGSVALAGYSAPKYLITEMVKFGGPLSTIFGGIQPANPTGLSAALLSQTIAPYLFVGAAQAGGISGAGVASGAGIVFLIDAHWFADVRYENIQFTGGNQISPVQSVPQMNIVLAAVNYKF